MKTVTSSLKTRSLWKQKGDKMKSIQLNEYRLMDANSVLFYCFILEKNENVIFGS